jgi:HSP20 family protein
MANFFEKLKKGMGIEISEKEETEMKEEKKKVQVEIQKERKNEIEINEEKKNEEKEKWLEPEGELAVDMYQTEEELVILSTIAGVKREDLNIYLEGEILFIEGERKKPIQENGDYFLQECYWGKFSRKIVLPVEINPEKISATFKDGILIIRIQKISKERKRKIKIE